MKTTISIPYVLFAAAERLARRLGVSRSQLYRSALAAYLERHHEDEVTARLDRVYGSASPVPVDPGLDRLMHASLPREDW